MKEKILNFLKKLVYNKKQDKLSIYKMLIIFMLVVVSISVGYSSLSSTLNITGIVSEIRLKSDIRITGLSASSSANSGKSNYAEYNKDSISVGVSLPSTDSTVTYKVKVTNIGNVEMGIKSISGLSYGFAYDIKDYTIGEKICDESNVCKLGISKEFYITIRYAYDYQEYLATNTDYISSSTYNFDLEFDFRPAYTVTYTGIEGDYQTTILEGNTLRVNFGSNAPENIKVLMDNTEISDYTYSDGVLELENVSGNIDIQKYFEPTNLNTYLSSIYNANSTVTDGNAATYNVDTKNMLIDDGFGAVFASEGNLRYYGANPNNYIDIGDKDSEGNTVLWRIIGLFRSVEIVDSYNEVIGTQDLVKIVRASSIGNIAFDTSGSNNWQAASLNTYLNTGEYYTGLNTSITQKVEKVIWNLGSVASSSSSSSYYGNLYSNDYYGLEQAIDVEQWAGNIGLIYPSDYGYATNIGSCKQTLLNYNSADSSYSCRENDWLLSPTNSWTLTPLSDVTYRNLGVYSYGQVEAIYSGSTVTAVYPTLYLKSYVTVSGGSGKVNDTVYDPYVLEDKKVISFTIYSEDCYAYEGMTWGEWLESDFNVGNHSSGTVTYQMYAVEDTDEIIDGAYYSIVGYEAGPSN